MAVDENQGDPWYSWFRQNYQLESTEPIIRLMIQQSNCFVIVERGKVFNNMMQERALADSGEVRAGSHFGKGQMVSADYTMSPSVTISQQDTGGLGARGRIQCGGWCSGRRYEIQRCGNGIDADRQPLQCTGCGSSRQLLQYRLCRYWRIFLAVLATVPAVPIRKHPRAMCWMPRSWIPTTSWFSQCEPIRHRQ